MKKNLKFITTSLFVALTLVAPASTMASSENPDETDCTHQTCSVTLGGVASDNKIPIFADAIGMGVKPSTLQLVCKEWYHIIRPKNNILKDKYIKAWHGVTPQNEKTSEQFLNGALIYRPVHTSEECNISIKFSASIAPFNKMFNLSKCGDADKDLVITTDPSVFFSEREDKIVILITLHSLAKKKLDTTCAPFKPIMKGWNEGTAPVGLFWRLGGWADLTWYDYLTSSSLSDISSRNLFENWSYVKASGGTGVPAGSCRSGYPHTVGRDWAASATSCYFYFIL